MISTVSTKLTNYLSSKGIVDKTDKYQYDWLKYGFEITLSSLLNLIIVVSIGIAFRTFIETLAFVAVFIPLRQYSGGYHANTYFKCNFILTISYISLNLIYKFININHITVLIMVAFSVVITLLFAPVENKNKPFENEKHRNSCFIISIILTIGEICILVPLYLCNVKFALMGLLSLQLVAVLIIFGKFQERRILYNEKN